MISENITIPDNNMSTDSEIAAANPSQKTQHQCSFVRTQVEVPLTIAVKAVNEAGEVLDKHLVNLVGLDRFLARCL